MIDLLIRFVGKFISKYQKEGFNAVIEGGMRFISYHSFWTFAKRRMRLLRQNLKYPGSSPDTYKIIHVDPKDINYVQAPWFHGYLRDNWGTWIQDGDWDTVCYDEEVTAITTRHFGRSPALVKMTNYIFLISVVRHFREGVSRGGRQSCLRKLYMRENGTTKDTWIMAK